MEAKQVSMEELKELENYFVSLGVDGRFDSLIARSVTGNGVSKDKNVRMEICNRVIELCMEKQKDIPKIISKVMCDTENMDDYFELRIALHNASVRNKKIKSNYK